MSDLEQRVSELERRISLLEQRDAPLQPQTTTGSLVPNAPNVPDATALVKVDISNKRFDPAAPTAGTLQSHLWFDCVYTLLANSKPARAIKGSLEFMDLFGEVKFRLQCTLNDALEPGKPIARPGTGFVFNQFMADHKWMQATDARDMKVAFRAQSILYSDGTNATL